MAALATVRKLIGSNDGLVAVFSQRARFDDCGSFARLSDDWWKGQHGVTQVKQPTLVPDQIDVGVERSRRAQLIQGAPLNAKDQ